jgi:hypothetical protein
MRKRQKDRLKSVLGKVPMRVSRPQAARRSMIALLP